MAERRMFSKKIINSAKFLKMPNETQCLYFHLGLNADDDGVVEAFTVMRLIGSTEDSLKILNAKGFIKILNDDLVSFIMDWQEHNKIRSDRKINSLYQNLLIEIIPDVKLLEPRHRADRKSIEQNLGTSHGQQMDRQRTDNGRRRLGKDRLGKNNNNSPNKNQFGQDIILNWFNTVWDKYPKKEGKHRITKSISKLKELYKNKSNVEIAVKNYSEKVKDTDRKYIKNGSTFFNGDWQDYIYNVQETKPEFNFIK